MFTSSVVDRGFEPLSGQTKDYKICICCFSAKHTALKRKGKSWLAWNKDNECYFRKASCSHFKISPFFINRNICFYNCSLSHHIHALYCITAQIVACIYIYTLFDFHK